jgi:tetrahydromethanopterin S-methyltransferase subunit H
MNAPDWISLPDFAKRYYVDRRKANGMRAARNAKQPASASHDYGSFRLRASARESEMIYGPLELITTRYPNAELIAIHVSAPAARRSIEKSIERLRPIMRKRILPAVKINITEITE